MFAGTGGLTVTAIIRIVSGSIKNTPMVSVISRFFFAACARCSGSGCWFFSSPFPPVQLPARHCSPYRRSEKRRSERTEHDTGKSCSCPVSQPILSGIHRHRRCHPFPTDAKSPLVLTAGHRIAHPDLLPLNAANVVSVIRRTRKYASPQVVLSSDTERIPSP